MAAVGSRVYSGLVTTGAVTALALLLNEGRTTPIFLLVLYIGWVILPFGGLLAALRLSRRWHSSVRVVLSWLMPIIVGGSVAAYVGLLTATNTKPAAIFLMIPLFSLVLLVLAVSIAVTLSRRRA